MPILSGRSESMSEATRAPAQLRQRIEDERIVGKQRDGMADAGAQAVQHARAVSCIST